MATIEITSNAISYLGISSSAATLRDAITPVLGDYANEYDLEAIEADYREEIEQLLPETWAIGGNFIFAESGTALGTQDDLDLLREEIEQINLTPIIERHELPFEHAIWADTDDTVTLVKLASDDTWLEVLGGLTEEQCDEIHAGKTEFQVGASVEVGNGETFLRLRYLPGSND